MVVAVSVNWSMCSVCTCVRVCMHVVYRIGCLFQIRSNLAKLQLKLTHYEHSDSNAAKLNYIWAELFRAKSIITSPQAFYLKHGENKWIQIRDETKWIIEYSWLIWKVASSLFSLSVSVNLSSCSDYADTPLGQSVAGSYILPCRASVLWW